MRVSASVKRGHGHPFSFFISSELNSPVMVKSE